MGSCMSVPSKAESPIHPGKNGILSSNVSLESELKTPLLGGEISQSSEIKIFSFNKLKKATRNFRDDNLLGEGGFRCVFKGSIHGNTIIVKRLHKGYFGEHMEWLAEINYLGQLHHPNLVKLIGYCLENDQRFMVYEFMPLGSLEDQLFRSEYLGNSNFQRPSWSIRLKVALGAAKGLAYLHSQEARLIYYRFKTSNILLDSNYNAKLSNFGLAKDEPFDDICDVLKCKFGYTAPEFFATGHLTSKSDVYSFGIILLEIMTGRRVLDNNRPQIEQNLVKWVKIQLDNKNKAINIMDPFIEGQYSVGGALRVAKLAIKCLDFNPKARPKMDEIVKFLEKIQERESAIIVENN